MIDPKELRIGNWYRHENGSDYVLSLDNWIDILFSYRNDEYLKAADITWMSGVPITPEWLERLGFKSDQFFDDTRPIFYLGDFYIDWDTLQPQDCGFDIAKIKIKYIHQLQNLYHALTGKDLELKPI